MSKLTLFILFNGIVYVCYALIDTLFSICNLYSNPQLGETLTIVPTSRDIVLIFLNVFISSVIGLYLTHKIKRYSGE